MDSTLKQRAVIESLVKLGEVSPTKIHVKPRGVYQEETMAQEDTIKKKTSTLSGDVFFINFVRTF